MTIGSHRVQKVQPSTQGVKPALSKQWKKTQPCESVQKAYTNSRTHDINVNHGAGLRAQAEYILGGSEAYDRLTQVLQSRDLTINIKASNWFSSPNLYESYTQMYERAIDKHTGEMILTDTAVNKATDRAMVDDNVTFPADWHQSPLPQNLQKRTGGSGGLDPRFQPSNDRIMGRLKTGDLVESQQGSGQFKSTNKLFNPKTKQVFAALNYGRRPHGSSTYYGLSYFVLKPDLKVNAIYFPCDTFCAGTGAQHQVTYQTLGAIVVHAFADMSQTIWNACMENMRLPDTDDMNYLLEAHIFEKIPFTAMSRLYLCVSDLDPRKATTILQNAHHFCKRWNIVLTAVK